MDIATLYFTLSPKCPTLDGQLLTIDGRPIRFLHPEILGRGSFSEVKLDEIVGSRVQFSYELELFAPWRLRMLAVTVEIKDNEDANQVKGMVARHLLEHFGREHCQPLYFYSCLSANQNNAKGFVSVCLRGAQGLSMEKFPEEAGLRMVYDAKGFAMVGERPQVARYQRLVLLYTVALAYQEQLQSFISGIRDSLVGGEEAALLRVQEEALRFNALYYLDNPVLVGTVELRSSWRTLADSFQLRDTHQELQNLLLTANQLTTISNGQAPAINPPPAEHITSPTGSAPGKAGAWPWLATSALLVLMLIALLQVTPGSISRFGQAWSAWFAGLEG